MDIVGIICARSCIPAVLVASSPSCSWRCRPVVLELQKSEVCPEKNVQTALRLNYFFPCKLLSWPLSRTKFLSTFLGKYFSICLSSYGLRTGARGRQGSVKIKFNLAMDSSKVCPPDVHTSGTLRFYPGSVLFQLRVSLSIIQRCCDEKASGSPLSLCPILMNH